jgi:nitrogen fixation protein
MLKKIGHVDFLPVALQINQDAPLPETVEAQLLNNSHGMMIQIRVPT